MCRLPTIQQEVQQRKLLYMGLYLLIWGEAANLRFMPECLCYIYHHVRSTIISQITHIVIYFCICSAIVLLILQTLYVINWFKNLMLNTTIQNQFFWWNFIDRNSHS
jgi:hypothetical protein